MRPKRVSLRRRPPRVARARRRLVRLAGGHRWTLRRAVLVTALLVAALLAVLVFPLPSLMSGGPPQQTACQGQGCRAHAASVQRWAVRLPGAWSAGTGGRSTGDGGTVPAVGQAYVAVGGGVAVLGTGLSLTGYRLDNGSVLWQVTLDAPAGSVIMSVRAWQGVVTVGLLAPSGRSRIEMVIDGSTGLEIRRYPAAVFGGAVAASPTATVVIGPASVTSYDNATGHVRWRREIAGQSWQIDGKTLYVAESRGGSLGSAAVTALRVVNLATGAQRMLASPLGRPFSGTLAIAEDGTVLFASPAGVTAYSGSTGGTLWTMNAAVPEGTDPEKHLVYLTSASGALTGVDPLTGTVRASVSGSAAAGSAGMYVVRGGVALGLDSGANGEAWGYNVTAGRVSWTSPLLPWPHFFSDLSGLGGSAAVSGDVVVVSACRRLAASPGLCADPELVAFSLLRGYLPGGDPPYPPMCARAGPIAGREGIGPDRALESRWLAVTAPGSPAHESRGWLWCMGLDSWLV